MRKYKYEPEDLGAGAAGEAREGRAAEGRVAQVGGEGGEEHVEGPALLLEVGVVARGGEEGERARGVPGGCGGVVGIEQEVGEEDGGLADAEGGALGLRVREVPVGGGRGDVDVDLVGPFQFSGGMPP